MMKHQRGAVTAVMNMSLFVLLLLSGLLCGASGLQRQYHYINENMTWTDAQSYCRERYTDLATVDSMDDMNTMMNTVNDGYRGSVWIGMQNVAQSHWVWSNGDDTISQYSPWLYGKPINGADCAFFVSNSWYDYGCGAQLYFACYNETSGYIMINSYENWTDAQSYCRQYHTDLATIHNSQEQNQLYAIVGNGPWVWIGLFQDSWQWSDQWSRYFRNWATGLPSKNSGFGDCAAMLTVSKKWVQTPCHELHHFICYADVKQQTVRLKLSFDEKYNLHDPSLQSAILNKISEKLKSARLESHSTISWRTDEDGEVFHPESKSTSSSNNPCGLI